MLNVFQFLPLLIPQVTKYFLVSYVAVILETSRITPLLQATDWTQKQIPTPRLVQHDSDRREIRRCQHGVLPDQYAFHYF